MHLIALTSQSSIPLGSDRSQITWKSYWAHKADDTLLTLTTFNAKQKVALLPFNTDQVSAKVMLLKLL